MSNKKYVVIIALFIVCSLFIFSFANSKGDSKISENSNSGENTKKPDKTNNSDNELSFEDSKKELNAIWAEIKTLISSDYTEDSWKSLDEACNLPETTKEEVLAKLAAIRKAKSDLVLIDETENNSSNNGSDNNNENINGGNSNNGGTLKPSTTTIINNITAPTKKPTSSTNSSTNNNGSNAGSNSGTSSSNNNTGVNGESNNTGSTSNNDNNNVDNGSQSNQAPSIDTELENLKQTLASLKSEVNSIDKSKYTDLSVNNLNSAMNLPESTKDQIRNKINKINEAKGNLRIRSSKLTPANIVVNVEKEDATSKINITSSKVGNNIILQGTIENKVDEESVQIYSIPIKFEAPDNISENMLKNATFKIEANNYGFSTKTKLVYDDLATNGNYFTYNFNIQESITLDSAKPLTVLIDWGNGEPITYSIDFRSITIR